MRYQLSATPEGLRSKAATVLSALADRPLFFAKHQTRHPLGIYNLTFSEIVRHMKSVLDELDKAANEVAYASPKSGNWQQPLLNSTDHLLDAIIQHLDAFSSIVEAFFENKADKDLERLNKNIKAGIRPYRNRVGQIVNAIKHRHAKLASIHFHNIGLFVPGYFVEGVCEGGAIGPDPTIHPASNTAISFNRDLPFHMVNLYLASSVLGGQVQELVQTSPSLSTNELNTSDTDLAELMRRLSILPRVFFPDEVRMPVPSVQYRGEIAGSAFSVLLELPAQRIKARTIPSGTRSQVTWSGDGASKTFKVPYWEARTQ